MLTKEVFRELLKIPGISGKESGNHWKIINYLIYNPYRWDVSEMRFREVRECKKAIFLSLIFSGMTALTLAPLVYLQNDKLGRKLIHVLMGIVLFSISFVIHFHNKTCSKFCQFSNDMLRHTGEISGFTKGNNL